MRSIALHPIVLMEDLVQEAENIRYLVTEPVISNLFLIDNFSIKKNALRSKLGRP
jgi:hypothetical protein